MLTPKTEENEDSRGSSSKLSEQSITQAQLLIRSGEHHARSTDTYLSQHIQDPPLSPTMKEVILPKQWSHSIRLRLTGLDLQPPKCGAPGLDFVDTARLKHTAIGGPWQVSVKGEPVNIDHVCAFPLSSTTAKLVFDHEQPTQTRLVSYNEFFIAQLKAGFTCVDITSLLDVDDGSTGGTRLNTIFGQLASLTNLDFLGMNAALNRFKGTLCDPNLKGADLGYAHPEACIQSLNNIAVELAMTNDDKVKALSSATNGRIYAAFKGIDDTIIVHLGYDNPLKGTNGDPIQATWADAYSTRLTDKVKSNNNPITKTASKISASISTDVSAAPANKQDGIRKRVKARHRAPSPPSTSRILASMTSPGFTCTSSL